MFNHLITIILFTISSFVFAADRSIQEQLVSQGYIELPLYHASKQNTLIVKFSTINAKKYSFIIDTGATFTTLDTKVEKDLNLQEQKINLIMGGGDANRHRAPQVIIPTFKSGRFKSKNEIAYVMDKSFIKIDNNPIAGFIGLDFLSNHAAVLDIANDRLYLKINSDKSTKSTTEKYEEALISAGYKKISLKYSPSKHRLLKVSVNDAKPINFMLDSGMPQTTMSIEYAKSLNLKLLGQSIAAKGSGGGKMEMFKTHITRLFIDPVAWTPHEMEAMNFKYVQIGTPIFGVIGLDWMQANHAVIDLTSDILYVKSTCK